MDSLKELHHKRKTSAPELGTSQTKLDTFLPKRKTSQPLLPIKRKSSQSIKRKSSQITLSPIAEIHTNKKIKYILYITISNDCPNINNVRKIYEKLSNNTINGKCIINLYMPSDIIFIEGKETICDLGIECDMYTIHDMEYSNFKIYPHDGTSIMLKHPDRCTKPLNKKLIICTFISWDKYTAKIGDSLVHVRAIDNKRIKVQLIDNQFS